LVVGTYLKCELKNPLPTPNEIKKKKAEYNRMTQNVQEESGELKERVMIHVSYYHTSLHFTSLHFTSPHRERNWAVPNSHQ
jgi:hypothetical protein